MPRSSNELNTRFMKICNVLQAGLNKLLTLDREMMMIMMTMMMMMC